MSLLADTLVPGVRSGAASPLDAALEGLSRPEREARVAALLAGPDAPEVERVLAVAAREHYADPAAWPALGYRDMPPGARWPEAADPAPATVTAPAGDYDAIVIGAGAGGGVAAGVLAEAGQRVLLAERGRALAREDLPRDHLRNSRVWTGVERFLDLREPRVTDDELVAPTDPAWNGNAFTVGGGTRVFGAQAWRFAPEDFRMGSAYGPPFTDWPIAYEDLEPYYDRVEWELGVAGPAGARPHDGPRRRGYPLPPIEDDAAQPVLARGAAALGIATAAVPLLINSVPYGGRPACRRCGTCVGFACQAGAKTGTHNSVIPRALATGRCDLLAGTAATRLLTRGGAVVGAQLGPHAVRARHVVLAAGAIESARLLLVSGVGNEHVGRYLQGHRYAGAAGLFAERVQDSRGPGSSISTTDFRHDNPGVRGGGVLANEFVPIPVEAYAKLTACGLVPPWGQAGLEAMRHAYPRAQFVVGPVQEVPSAESRVTLATVKDAAGVPVARLTGRPDPADAATAQFLSARAAEWLEASGARRIAPVHFRARRGPSAGQHQAGTCRMGAVTDAWGRVHGHAGVTIADASLHVTNGGVNPVLTVLALAWRNAERLAAELS